MPRSQARAASGVGTLRAWSSALACAAREPLANPISPSWAIAGPVDATRAIQARRPEIPRRRIKNIPIAEEALDNDVVPERDSGRGCGRHHKIRVSSVRIQGQDVDNPPI